MSGPDWKATNVNNRFSKKALPSGGTDVDGAAIYVGRSTIHDVVVPAKVIPERQRAYVCYRGEEVFVENYEILRGKEKHFSWVPASNGNVPDLAVSTGTDHGEAIFVGRAPYQGSMTIGRVHPSHNCLYIPFGGAEIPLTDYEVLIYTKKPSRREKRRERRRKRRESSSSSSSSSSDDEQGIQPFEA